jgi:2-methylisocitrate lyase-like PEP mutase family enzyme
MRPPQTVLPEERRPLLRRLLQENRVLRAIECHTPLSALLGASAQASCEGRAIEFDLLWASGFSHSTSLALPDAELSLLERRLDAIGDIAAVTHKALIVDADTGGDGMALGLLCRRLEALGASAVVVEDKSGVKRTSLAERVKHTLEDPDVFVEKIAHARRFLQTKDFLIFARIESLIAGVGLPCARGLLPALERRWRRHTFQGHDRRRNPGVPRRVSSPPG